MTPIAATSPTAAVDRHPALPYDRFAAEYLYPQRPVALAGAVRDWPAVGKWTPRFFAERFPDKELHIDRPYGMAEFIELVEKSDENCPAPYLHAQKLRGLFPELVDDITPLPVCVAPNWLRRRLRPGNVGARLNHDSGAELFIGGKAAGFPFLHWDELHYLAFVMQVYGEKKFYLYPPEQTPLVYPTPGRAHVALVRDVERPDLTRFPRFAEATPLTCVIGPGDVLFVPGGWWHTTRMLSASISISVNAANASNWPAVVRDLRDDMRTYHPYLAGPFAAYLRLVGRCRALRDRFAGRPPAGGDRLP